MKEKAFRRLRDAEEGPEEARNGRLLIRGFPQRCGRQAGEVYTVSPTAITGAITRDMIGIRGHVTVKDGPW